MLVNFNPQIWRDLWILVIDTTDLIGKCPIKSFGDSILLRRICVCGLMNNTVIRKKPLQAIVKEFSALIGAETYNFRIKLCSDEREKLLENFVSVVLPFEEINKAKSSLVVGY